MKDKPPALREKHRYIRYEICCETELEFGEAISTLWKSIEEYMGVESLSDGEVWIIKNKYDEKQQEGVIKVQKDLTEQVISALTLISNFGNSEGFVVCKNVSGTIKKV